MNDEHYMRHALTMARRGLGRVWPNPSVGCVIVKHGHVIAAARTADGGRPHAETIALQMAGADAKGATAYVSLEPCSHEGQTGPCALALVKAAVKRVVVACADPDPRVSGQGINILKGAGIEVEQGVLEREAQALNEGFIKRITGWRPKVTLKIAISADEKIAAAKGERTQISGAMAERYMHLMRARHDAILVGIGTALADDPMLTARLPGHCHTIIRCIMDSELRLPLTSKLVQSASKQPLFIFYREGDCRPYEAAGARAFSVDDLSPEVVLTKLAKEGVTRLMVEGGSHIAASFLEAGLVDEFHLIRSNQEIGAKGVAAIAGRALDDALLDFDLCEGRPLGEDRLEIYRIRV